MSLADISDAVGFSESYFSRIFKGIYGKSFHTFLNEFRVKEVEKLLLHKQLTIREAAFACGFNSVSTFNRIFKSIKGCSPSDYMKMKK